MAKARPPLCSGDGGEHGAAIAAMQVERQLGSPTADSGCLGRKQLVDIRVALKDGAKRILNYYCQTEIRTKLFQESESRGGEDTVTERPQPNNEHAAALRHSLQDGRHSAAIPRSWLRRST